MNPTITIQTSINAPIEKVWDFYTLPEHIVNWNSASEDWFTSHAENDLRAGGKFLSRMEARDGSEAFDFDGVYDEVVPHSLIKYTLVDDRKVTLSMAESDGQTIVTVTFDTEAENAPEMQQAGWQAILDSFKNYVESN